MHADLYQFWRDALAGNVGPIHDGDAQCGFWRKRKYKQGPFCGVAIYPDPETGEIVAVCDKAPVDPGEIWTWCVQHPVTEAAFREWESTGRWPDEDPTIGHNNAPADDDLDALHDQIESAKAGADAYAEIKDDETAAKAQSLRSRLLELRGQVVKIHKAQKEPHLEAGRAVDRKWFPLRDEADAAAKAIRAAMDAWETEKLRREREAARKAEEERRRQEEEARKAAEAGQPAPEPEPTPDPEPAPAPETSTTIRGGYGRAASTRVVKVATVVDMDKAYGFLKTHKELIELIGKLAQRAVDAGYEVPGVEVQEERRVR